MGLLLFKIALFIFFYGLWEFFLRKPKVDDFAKGLEAAESDDFETAYHQWRPLAEGGNSDAQYNLGWMYYYGEGVTRNLKTARKWLNRAMKQGDPRPYWLLGKVYSELGTIYQEGNGVSQNSKKANKLQRRNNFKNSKRKTHIKKWHLHKYRKNTKQHGKWKHI